MGRRDKYDWENLPLGKMPDKELADKHGIPVSAVNRARRMRKIANFNRGPTGNERFDWDKIPFGTKSDADLGREFGLKASSIGNARNRRGIPSFVEPGHRRPERAKRGIDWDLQPLGTVPDKVLQKRLGLKSVSSVTRARVYRGILKFVPPTHHKLIKLHDALTEKWDDLEAVEARYKELSEKAAAESDDAEQE